MIVRRTLLAVVMFLLPLTGLAQAYRWVDSEGNVHYSDTLPPPGAKDIEQLRLPDQPAAPQSLPYEVQQAAKNFPVTLYVTNCGDGCIRARQLLLTRGIPYTELDPSDPATHEALRKAAGGTAVVPLLLVGKQVLKGFDEKSWHAALDVAGYPKSALVKVTPTKPPKPAASSGSSQPPEEAEQPESAEQPEQPAENADIAGER